MGSEISCRLWETSLCLEMHSAKKKEQNAPGEKHKGGKRKRHAVETRTWEKPARKIVAAKLPDETMG